MLLSYATRSDMSYKSCWQEFACHTDERGYVISMAGKWQQFKWWKKNNIGLVIKIDYPPISEQQSVLLTGDCAYEALPQYLKEEKYCVVLSPHHGSAKTLPSFCKNTHNARAIISVGENKHNHPRIEHITELLERGFRVYFTAGSGGIEFFLDSKQRVRIRRFCRGKLN